MDTRDPAFLWETEVLRSSTQPPRVNPPSSEEPTDGSGDWLTLRRASEATGVPSSTIRKWARNESIPSFMQRTSQGQVRLVSMAGIKRWADRIGRDIESLPPDPIEPVGRQPETEETSVPEGSMLVPLDAWNRMLNQLGNLHEAGQQVAEARERAAKAETETRFLKERLADLREELERTKDNASNSREDPSSALEDETQRATSSPSSLIKRAYQGWRTRGSKRG